jgi:hypothetical protein
LYAILQRAYRARKMLYDAETFKSDRILSITRRHRDEPFLRYRALLALQIQAFTDSLAGRMGKAQTGRIASAEALRAHPFTKEYRKRYEKLGTEAVAAFSLEGNREMIMAEAANAAGIPVVVMIRSRDNLAAKIQHLPFAQKYLVWSEATKTFFLKMYPETDPASVVVTGSPQFDHHLDPAFRMSRDAFFADIGLDPTRPLLVYTMATPKLIDHEIDIVQHLADAAHAGKFAGNAQLLVRGHPRMFGSNLPLLRQEYPEAKAFPRPTPHAYLSKEHEAHVVRLLLEDERMHLSTLAYQAVQINVCGTMTIDSAILDKPVVNIYYDLPATTPSGLSVRRFYNRTDVQQMLSYGVSRLAHTPEEAIRLINRYLEDPAQDAAGRKLAREEDCGPLDGRAGARIAEVLQSVRGLHKPKEPVHAA